MATIEEAKAYRHTPPDPPVLHCLLPKCYVLSVMEGEVPKWFTAVKVTIQQCKHTSKLLLLLSN